MNFLACVYKMCQSSERVEFKMATGCNLLSLSASSKSKRVRLTGRAMQNVCTEFYFGSWEKVFEKIAEYQVP